MPALLPMLALFILFCGLAVSIYYRKLAASMPVLIAGFATETFVRLFVGSTSLMPLLFSRFGLSYYALMRQPAAFNVYSALTLLGVGGWGLVVLGLGLSLRELNQKLNGLIIAPTLTSLNSTPQNVNVLRNATDAYHQPAMNHPPPHEEIHVTAFAVPPASSPVNIAHASAAHGEAVQPVLPGGVEQPEHAITLGSTH